MCIRASLREQSAQWCVKQPNKPNPRLHILHRGAVHCPVVGRDYVPLLQNVLAISASLNVASCAPLGRAILGQVPGRFDDLWHCQVVRQVEGSSERGCTSARRRGKPLSSSVVVQWGHRVDLPPPPPSLARSLSSQHDHSACIAQQAPYKTLNPDFSTSSGPDQTLRIAESAGAETPTPQPCTRSVAGSRAGQGETQRRAHPASPFPSRDTRLPGPLPGSNPARHPPGRLQHVYGGQCPVRAAAEPAAGR